jgi:hypothetical protein
MCRVQLPVLLSMLLPALLLHYGAPDHVDWLAIIQHIRKLNLP